MLQILYSDILRKKGLTINVKKFIFSYFFSLLDNDNPSPGSYRLENFFNGKGTIFQSKFLSSPAKSILGRGGSFKNYKDISKNKKL